jgi:hypothetical protein
MAEELQFQHVRAVDHPLGKWIAISPQSSQRWVASSVARLGKLPTKPFSTRTSGAEKTDASNQ